MGPIQASLNQLTLSALGALGGAGYAFKSGFKKPEAPKPEVKKPEAETSSGMGNIAKVGRDYSRRNLRAYDAAARAVDSVNDAILQKATAKFSPEERIAQIKAATGTSFAAPKTKEKGGSK